MPAQSISQKTLAAQMYGDHHVLLRARIARGGMAGLGSPIVARDKFTVGSFVTP
jgi:hypothetical protein